MSALLSMQHIAKRFGPVQALSGVSLDLAAGEVLGIVGENGAGKSTLIKVLGGAHLPSEGTIVLDGQQVSISSPSVGLRLGIAVIYQELSLVPELSVAENLFLGHLPRTGLGGVRRGELLARSREILASLHLDIHPDTRVADLRLGTRQLIEIGKALSHKARVLVMDEPTSSLNEREVEHLTAVIGSLKARGVGIIYISHHLDEVFAVCDRVMVMRDGAVVGTRPTADWTPDAVVQAMVDRPIAEFYPKPHVAAGPELLSLSGIALGQKLLGVDLTVRAGEVLGLAGLPGCGASELGQIVGGLLQPTAGTMRWLGQPYQPHGPADALEAGIGFVPEDRKKDGLLLSFTIRENIPLSVLRRIAWAGVVDGRRKQELATAAVRDYRVKADGPAALVGSLSGGNQQKVLLARVSQIGPRLWVMNEPTRGIDVGAKVEIYERIGQFVQGGGAVLLLSAELPELIGLSDRIAVLRNGRKLVEVPRASATQGLIMSYAAGTGEGAQA